MVHNMTNIPCQVSKTDILRKGMCSNKFKHIPFLKICFTDRLVSILEMATTVKIGS